MISDDEVFAEALMRSPLERAAFLERACAGDAAQRARIEALLAGHAKAEVVMAAPLAGRVATADEQPGDVIGRYKLLQKIGEGGCGVVWMAEQEEPVRRRVALKVIKLGMDTKEVVARFEAERQALALMDHPNIARVFDGGATDTGRPFFVMELVRGVPITRYCDEARLSTAARLKLFIEVCHAVQHAHQKGIIHRDLKPSNILVTLHDDVAVPKVIDFGIAKATQGRLTDATLFTAFEQFIGTPAYMSPEQAEFNALDVDTRSDIYSLGVLLYELLTGQPPFDPKTLGQTGLDEIRRIIREVEPPRPSARVRTLNVAEASRLSGSKASAAGRRSHNELAGDLDWIVMKALEKNRTRRYESASAFAADLQRHLVHEPVLARPPSRVYLLNRFVRRHPTGVAATLAIVAVVAAGVRATTWQAMRATRAEREQARLRQTAEQAQAAESVLRQLAETQELATRRHAYASDMNLIQQALANDNLGRARELLDRHRPKPGESDLRGWEWRYLWQQCRGDEPTELCRKPGNISALLASSDGRWLAIANVPDDIRPGGLWVRDLHSQAETEIPLDARVGRMAFAPNAPLLAMALSGKDRARIRLWSPLRGATVREWLRPAGPCIALRFSRDGAEVLAAIQIRTKPRPTLQWLRWRTADGAPLDASSVEIESAGAQWADVTPDLRRAVFIEDPRRLTLVDLVTGTKVWSVPSENGDPWGGDGAISPDGQLVASIGGEGKTAILLWDGASGRKVGELRGHRAHVLSLAFSVDGRTLVSSGLDKTIRLWDVSGRRLVRTLRGHEQAVDEVALLPDRQTLISGARGGTIYQWDLAKPAPASGATVLPGEIVNWRFADDGRSVIAIAATGEVTRRSGRDFGTVEALMKLDPRLQLHFRWSALQADGSRLAAPTADGRIEVWDWERGIRCSGFDIGHPGAVVKAFLDHGEKLLVLTNEPDGGGTIREWDVARAVELRTWPVPRPAWPGKRGPGGFDLSGFVSLSADERQLWLLDTVGRLVCIDRAANTSTVAQLDVQNPSDLLVSPDGHRVVVRDAFVNVAKVWDARMLQPVATFSAYGDRGGGFAFSADGQRLALGGQGAEGLRLWDAENCEQLLALPTPVFLGGRAAFSPDGNVIGAQSTPNDPHLWRAPSWAEIAAAEKDGPWR